MVCLHDVVEDLSEELAAFLNGIETRGPKEEGSIVVYGEAKFFLKDDFIKRFVLVVALGGVALSDVGIVPGVEGGVG